jgi:hypothetical protein
LTSCLVQVALDRGNGGLTHRRHPFAITLSPHLHGALGEINRAQV